MKFISDSESYTPQILSVRFIKRVFWVISDEVTYAIITKSNVSHTLSAGKDLGNAQDARIGLGSTMAL